MKKYTISDIAAAAKVSNTTVSNFLNGHLDEMSAKTAERIQRVISEAGYRPSIIASSLKNSQNNLIGVILTHTKTMMARYLIHQLCIFCQDRQYHPLFTSIEDNEKNELDCIRHLVDYSVCGIITLSGTSARYMEKAGGSAVPLVACDRRSAGVDSVFMDYEKSVELLMDAAVADGYDSFSMFSFDTWRMPQSTVLIRERAYANYCDCHGIENNVYRIDPENAETSIISSLDHFLVSGGYGKKMVFVTNAPLLSEMDRTCLKHGLRSCELVSLYGYLTSSNTYDSWFYPDTNIKRVVAPPLDQMAKKSVDRLVDRLTESSGAAGLPADIVLEPVLISSPSA